MGFSPRLPDNGFSNVIGSGSGRTDFPTNSFVPASQLDLFAWGAWDELTGTAPTRTANGSSYSMGQLAATSFVQNDELGYLFSLCAGTYQFTLIHTKGSNIGIATVTIEPEGGSPTTEGTIDGYAGSLTRNQIDQISDITISDDGNYLVKLNIDTKNASSSAYLFRPQTLSMVRTGA